MRDSGHGNLFYGDSRRWTPIWVRSGIMFLMEHGNGKFANFNFRIPEFRTHCASRVRAPVPRLPSPVSQKDADDATCGRIRCDRYDRRCERSTSVAAGNSSDQSSPTAGSSPSSAAPPRELSLEQRADIFMARKNYADAADYYYRALKQSTLRDPMLWNKLGIAFQQENKFRNAHSAYTNATRLDRISPRAGTTSAPCILW